MPPPLGFALGIEILKAYSASEAYGLAPVKKVEPMNTITEGQEKSSEDQDKQVFRNSKVTSTYSCVSREEKNVVLNPRVLLTRIR